MGWFPNYFIRQKREEKKQNKFFQFSTALLSGGSFRLVAPGSLRPLRTVRASFQAHGSST